MNAPKRGKTTPRAKLRPSLGPVADLEAHLPEEWWSKLFNALYVKTDGDIYENDDNTRREVDFIIEATGIQPHSAVLDLCCGQGRHALDLARRGFTNITGIDRSRYLIRLARKRAEQAGHRVIFKEGDARQPRLGNVLFDCVIVMGNSFGFFSDESDDQRVLSAIARCLRPSGSLVLDLPDGDYLRDNFEPRSWEWIDAQHFVCRERTLSQNRDRLVSREVIVSDVEGVIADQFYAERLYSSDRIQSALASAGFRTIRHHGGLDAHSERNQDLGMMARRLMVTAHPPRQTKTPSRRTGRGTVSVTVVLGDPRLPDTVKRGGKFNTEDFETVEKLKDALAELPDYRFTYFDNHATIEQDLADCKDDLVLNLCDEGFNNDAFKEMHVPALLELNDLSYTGSGPGCLAMCYDKALVRAVAQSIDIPVPQETFVRPGDQGATLPSIFPAILKPNFGDSSIGITRNAVVNNKQELIAYLEELRAQFPGRPLLVQEFLQGTEYSVGLIGNPSTGLTVLPLLDVDYSRLGDGMPQILGYESKWHPDSPYWTDIGYRHAHVDEALQTQLVEYSTRLFERLGTRDYARFDFRADANGDIKLLEANPNPGWCWDGKMNLMAGFAGMRYSELLGLILAAAADRRQLGERLAA